MTQYMIAPIDEEKRVGGSLAFIATAAWTTNISGIGSGTWGDYLFKLIFIWFSIVVAIASITYGKWIPGRSRGRSHPSGRTRCR